MEGEDYSILEQPEKGEEFGGITEDKLHKMDPLEWTRTLLGVELNCDVVFLRCKQGV